VADWKDVILKPIFSHSSVDLVRIRAMPSDEDAIDEEILSWHLLRRHHVLCAQRFLPNPGRDLRIVVLQGRVVSSTYRIARSPTKRVHDHLYSYAQEPAPFQPDVESYAVRSCAVLGLDCASIDMVEGPHGVVILEVNPTVSIWRRLDQEGHHLTTGGIASAFVDMVIDAVNRNAVSNATSLRSI
jgi:glutathione synthase/RimK-type ligase-like ATP-grasp enzyme